MKKLVSLLSLLLLSSIGVWAQSWTPPSGDNSQYPHETIVYATVESNLPLGLNSPCEIGAFIDGECRAQGTTSDSRLFLFRVGGTSEELNSKEITFKFYYYMTNAEYEIKTKDGSKVMFDGESHAYPSDAIVLSLTAATSYSMPDLTIKVGDEVNLLDRLVTEPENAQVPDNAYWVKYSDCVTLDGHTIVGTNPGGTTLDLYVPDGFDNSNNPTFKHACGPIVTVIQPATGIEIVTDTYYSWVGDDCELSVFMSNRSNSGNAYRLIPTNATADVKWEVNSEYISYQEGFNCPWTAIKGGTTQIRPYFETEDGTKVYPADNKWITINISVPAESVTAKQEIFYANVGDDISNRIDSYFTVLPEDATNKTLTYVSADEETLKVNADGSIVALKASTGTTLYAYVDGVQTPAEITVVIEDWATSLNFAENPLTVTLHARESLSIYETVLNNINYNKANYFTNFSTPETYSFLTVESNTRAYNNIGSSYTLGDIKVSDEGTAIVNVTLNWYDYSETQYGFSGTPMTATFPLTVNIEVNILPESIQVKNEQMYANVGDDITSRLNDNVTVLPEDATNKALDWEVDGVNIVDNGGRFIATKRSWNNIIQVSSQSNPDVGAEFTVTVQDPVKTVNTPDNPLTLTITTHDTMTDLTQQIVNNINMVGYVDDNVSVTVTAAGKMNGSGLMTGNGYFGDSFQTNEEGETTITVVATWNDWANYSGTGDCPRKSVTATFRVIVTAQIDLVGFNSTITEGAAGETTVVTLTPLPADATYNTSDLNIIVHMEGLDGLDNGWGELVYATTTKNSNNETVITVESPVPGLIEVVVEDENGEIAIDGNGSLMFEIPDIAVLPAGWSWRSQPYGNLFKESQQAKETNIFTAFFHENALYEIRTQKDLLINDPSWGYFGTLTEIPQNTCYKLKMNSTVSSEIYEGSGIGMQDVIDVTLFANGYTWVCNPYFFNRLLDNALKADLVEGLVIISKDGGSAEWNGTKWVGDLTTLKRDEGYIVYNPGSAFDMRFTEESTLLPQDEGNANGARANIPAARRIWQYDASQFMSNMTMVASLPDLDNLDDWTLGAFVGDECRGEGIFVDGLAFITVHSDGAEKVSFKLYNFLTDEYFDIDETFDVQGRVGSLKAPVQLHSNAVVTGIEEIENGESRIDNSSEAIYNQNGVRQQQMRRGLNIVRMADGSVKKIVVK